MSSCKGVETPLPTSLKLKQPDSTLTVSTETQSFPFANILGGIRYLVTCTRPDICFATNLLSRYMKAPSLQHIQHLKRLMRYLQHTKDYGICFYATHPLPTPFLFGYSDADWGGDQETLQSTSGFVYLLARGSISWQSKKQDRVTLSSTEAEYVAMTLALKEGIWLKHLLMETTLFANQPLRLLCDNMSAIMLARNLKHSEKTKHIAMKLQFIRELIQEGTIELTHVRSDQQLADFLTKSIPKAKHLESYQQLGICVWKYEKSEGHDNWGLLASEKARKYGIATRFPEVVEFKEKPIVLQMISDPNDEKPDNWDERAKIPDPEAVKPEDWDEDAPYDIEDMDATKPEGWLDDEPDEIDDVDAVKPEDWDDDEDGEWEAPKIPNPKCVDGPRCGEWTRPNKKNPAFKGKWYAPMIDNPAYKGIWKAQEIPNLDYFYLEKPNLEPISAVAIEIWTMQDGILFDNMLITSNVDVAAEYREKEWKIKYEAEKAQQKKEEAVEAAKESLFVRVTWFSSLCTTSLPMLASQKDKLVELIERGEENPLAVLGISRSVTCVVLTIIFRFLFMGKKSKTLKKASLGKAKKEDITPHDDDVKSCEKPKDKEKGKEIVNEEIAVAEEVFATRHRRPRRRET
ncbi:hypothetical protein L7F22_022339 [Adiantum nelumboides]|nr:hypothetical protein [Adiantum nelumboides]